MVYTEQQIYNSIDWLLGFVPFRLNSLRQFLFTSPSATLFLQPNYTAPLSYNSHSM